MEAVGFVLIFVAGALFWAAWYKSQDGVWPWQKRP